MSTYIIYYNKQIYVNKIMCMIYRENVSVRVRVRLRVRERERACVRACVRACLCVRVTFFHSSVHESVNTYIKTIRLHITSRSITPSHFNKFL